jgi:hypothetical protein
MNTQNLNHRGTEALGAKLLFALPLCLGGLLFAGCDQDPRVARQQEQISALTRQVEDLKTRVQYLSEAQDHEYATSTNLYNLVKLDEHPGFDTGWATKQILDLTVETMGCQMQLMQITNYLGVRYLRVAAAAAVLSDTNKVDPSTGLPWSAIPPVAR